MSLSDPLPGPGRPPASGLSRHVTIEQARRGATGKVDQARRAIADLERRHDRATARVEALSRRRAALELELADAERERDQTEARLTASRQALVAAEGRLDALDERD